MAIQALAPYYCDDTSYTYTNKATGERLTRTVRQCVDDALLKLASMMSADGGFSTSFDDQSVTVESTAQVIVALCALGIDPLTDVRFITSDNKTLIDGLLAFRLDDGGFCHTPNGAWNSMATDQAEYALVALWRFKNGMRALYDMRPDMTPEEASATESAERAVDAITTPADKGFKSSVKAALDAFYDVPRSERRYVCGYEKLASALEIVGGADKLDTADAYPISISVTSLPRKISYTEGETFDPDGMAVTALYSDGTSRRIEGYKYSPAGALTSNDDAVTIVCIGLLKTEVKITVSPLSDDKADVKIGSAEELMEFAKRVNGGESFTGKTVLQTADIDLDGIANWTPVGDKKSAAFNGTFDGRHYKIENLKSDTAGLFGYVGSDAVIRGVDLASGSISTRNMNFGGIVAVCGGADIIDCHNDADITTTAYTAYCGGVVGRLESGLVFGCFNTGNIKAVDGPIGGVVGYVPTDAKATVENCYNTGSVALDEYGWWAGGVVGQIQDNNTIRNCYNAGAVSGSESGAVVGMITNNVTAENCYFDRDVFEVGLGNKTREEVVGMTSDEMKDVKFADALGGAFKSDRYGLVNSGYPLLAWQDTPDADRVDDVKSKIDAIGSVAFTPESADAIKDARREYDALDDALKQYVANYSSLTAAEAAFAELTAAAKAAAISYLEGFVDPDDYREAERADIEYILSEASSAIEEAESSDEIEKIVSEAKEKLRALATDKQLSDKEAADEVSSMIDSIGIVTLESEDAIRTARGSYDALNDDAKLLVSNYGTLEKAEAELSALKEGTLPTPPETNDPPETSPAPETPVTPDTPDTPETVKPPKTGDETSDAYDLAMVCSFGVILTLIIISAIVEDVSTKAKHHYENI